MMMMPYKPEKYWLKIVCLTDAYISYLYNTNLYLGKDSHGISRPTKKKPSNPT